MGKKENRCNKAIFNTGVPYLWNNTYTVNVLINVPLEMILNDKHPYLINVRLYQTPLPEQNSLSTNNLVKVSLFIVLSPGAHDPEGGVTLGNVSCNLSRNDLNRALQRCETSCTRGVTLCIGSCNNNNK